MESVRLVSTLIEVSELFHSRARLVSPRYRLHALLALIPTGRRFGIRTTVLEQEVTACLETITAARGRSASQVEVGKAARQLLSRCCDSAHLAQQSARALFRRRAHAWTLDASTWPRPSRIISSAFFQGSWLHAR